METFEVGVYNNKWASLGVRLETRLDKHSVFIIDTIFIPKYLRRQGLGTTIVKELCAFTDSLGLTTELVPSSLFGSDIKRLLKFYRSFGFISKSYLGLVRYPTKRQQ